MVIVCTAAILQKCLAHGYISILDINLLIFDEAHHAKKNHTYSCIIKDYYNREEKGKRPRILGMTASPVDTKEDVQFAAERLELLLQSRIASVSEGTLGIQLGRKNHEEVVEYYHTLPLNWESDLVRSLDLIIANHPLLKKQLRFSKDSAREHGAWFAHQYWKLCFRDTEYAKWMAKAESFDEESMIRYAGGEAVDVIRRVHSVVKAYQLPKLSDKIDLISTKTNCLLRILEKYFSYDKDHNHKCIVFVDQRNTALMLTEMFNDEVSDVLIPYLKPAYLFGSQRDGGPCNMSYRDAVLTIHKFRKGELNCLFASSVAEEGIDIPDCDVIIRFDLPTSMIQYIQSKGRARHANSTFISMAEYKNSKQSKMIRDAAMSAQVLRQFCAKLPEDRFLGSRLLCSVEDWERGLAEEHYNVPQSGAKLTFSHSLEVLTTFVSSLQDAADINPVPDYMVMREGDYYRALVHLPEKSPIRTMYGDPMKSRHDAKCSAAFKLCIELINKKYIDENLQSSFKKYLPAMRNARLAISCNKKEHYNMLLKPAIWSEVGPIEKLYCVVLTLDRPQSVGRPSRPLILLTRKPLPQMSKVPLFFGDGKISCVDMQLLPNSLDLGGNKSPLVEGLLGFTLRVFQDVFSKCFDAKASEFPYFLAPSSKPHDYLFTQVHDPADIIDWPAVRLAAENGSIKIGPNDDPAIYFRNRFVKDPFDGSRKLYTIKVRPDMHPSDPVPEGLPAPRHRGWRSVEHTISEYSNSLWMNSRARKTWDMTQPVIEAVTVSLRRNLLDDFEDEDATNKPCFIIIEPLDVSSVSSNFVPRSRSLLTCAAFYRVRGHGLYIPCDYTSH
jgi:endoribonuclease Dicer